MNTNILHKDLAYEIVGAAMDVHNALGPGFLEKVYENALVIALRKRGLGCQQQAPIEVRYEEQVVGLYFADILVEDVVIIELKAVHTLSDIHRAQAINYLRATGLHLVLLINFGKPKLEWERIVL